MEPITGDFPKLSRTSENLMQGPRRSFWKLAGSGQTLQKPQVFCTSETYVFWTAATHPAKEKWFFNGPHFSVAM